MNQRKQFVKIITRCYIIKNIMSNYILSEYFTNPVRIITYQRTSGKCPAPV